MIFVCNVEISELLTPNSVTCFACLQELINGNCDPIKLSNSSVAFFFFFAYNTCSLFLLHLFETCFFFPLKDDLVWKASIIQIFSTLFVFPHFFKNNCLHFLDLELLERSSCCSKIDLFAAKARGLDYML